MIEDDRSYYERRAGIEIDQAAKATKPEVIKAHRLLAKEYLRKLAVPVINRS